ncbi:hypothetical protein C808_01126 [Lachnospiraceae bacterium M18-1]|jgi:integrase|nr:hypothetical protein C808_01126 [Lachnospiraceae bacterium M18-1]MCI8561797.1 site-specific integrase [Dorea sp.]
MDLSEIRLRPFVSYDVSNVLIIKGKYGFRVTLIYEDGSKKVRQHAGYGKKTEANKARNHVIGQLHTGTYVVYPNIKVGDFLEYWLEYVMRPEIAFTANSYHTYRNCIRNHIIPQLGNLKLSTLNQGHLYKLYKKLADEYISIPKLAKTIMNTSMHYALKKHLVAANPCKDVNLPKKVSKTSYHTIEVKEAETYSLEQVKRLMEASKESKIHMQLVFALLMGLRRSEINGVKYSDVDFVHRKLKIQRQLGEDLHTDPEKIPANMRTKQEIRPKTRSSVRELDIPDYVFQEILEERKRYEKNRSRRQSGKWVFQDLDYICCSSYGRPRSKSYAYVHYKELLEKEGLPYIPFHNLRHTYATLLMKNNINQKAVAVSMGHAKSMITVDTYADMQAIIEDCEDEIQEFIRDVHPYDRTDEQMLKEMFQEEIDLQEENGNAEQDDVRVGYYDYSDVEEMDDINEWYLGEGQ